MADACVPNHDWFTATLTFGLCCGLVISYAPQHFRIIHAASSEGFSPIFLLLGSTSSAAGMFNMITMQWRIVKCCRVVSFGSCVEMTAGIVQVGLQWFLFSFIFVLYMMYYPPHLKYVSPLLDSHDTRPLEPLKAPIKSKEWQLSVVLSWVTIAHLAIISCITFFLLFTSAHSPSPSSPLPSQISSWATFLGVSSAILAAIQYAPQLVHTYRMKLVGALSIPMMCIQSPGAVFMVLSIALRPGTNWTSWITFAVAGIMQGSLLIMCIIWKLRQGRLGIDDFGHPVESFNSHYNGETLEEYQDGLMEGAEEPSAVRSALAAALESAAEGDVRDGVTTSSEVQDSSTPEVLGEETPLLGIVKDGKQRGRIWASLFSNKRTN